MKWFLILLVFLTGSYFFISRRNEAARQKVLAEQQLKAAEEVRKASLLKTQGAVLPLQTKRSYVMKFSPQTLKTLRAMTHDADVHVRAASVELLWQLQDQQAPAIIKRMFQEETEESIKKGLIDLLAKDKSKMSLALLAEALKSYDKETRLKAVEAVGTFSNKEAIIVLNRGLEDYDEDVRLNSLKSLNRIRHDIETHKEQELREVADSKPLFKVE